MNTHLSPEVFLNIAFDLNHTSLAPPWTQVLIFEDHTKRRKFVQNGVEGWYWGLSPERYWCYIVCPSHTCREDIQDSGIFPHNFLVPKHSSADAARQSVEDLVEALNNPAPASQFAVGDEQVQAIKNLQ